MAGILTFNVGEVRRLMEHAKAAKLHSPSYEDLFNPAYHKGGKVKKVNGWPDHDNIDRAAIPPALHLVKDHGIYVMSNGSPRQLIEGTDKSVVAYAIEANPNKLEFDEWWETAGRIMGGDDCVITLPLPMFETATKDKNDSDTFRLKVTKRAISLPR